MFRIAGVFYALVLGIITPCFAIEEACTTNEIELKDIQNFRELVRLGAFSELMEFARPRINVQLFGRMIKMDVKSINRYESSIFDDKTIEKILTSDECDFITFFGLEWDADSPEITQLVFNFDQEDLKFNSSGIPSVYELRAFIAELNFILDKQNFESLSEYVNYPFKTTDGMEIINEIEFKQNFDKIVTKDFIQLLRDAKDESNFHHHYTGIRLNYEGDVWIRYYRDRLLLDIYNW